MITNKLTEILNDSTDCAATIVTSGPESFHLSNTWNSYIRVVDEERLYIPAGGMNQTESNLKLRPEVKLSISNRNVQGHNFPGTGVIVEGTARIIYDDAVDVMKKEFPWIRAVLEVTVKKVSQTM